MSRLESALQYEIFLKQTELYDEIVFARCDENIFRNIEAIILSARFSLMKRGQEKNDERYVYKRDRKEIVVCKSYSLDAIFLYLSDMNKNMFAQYLSQCPVCASADVVEGIPQWMVRDNLSEIRAGGLVEYLPGAYDRIGIPIPNWRCRKCGFRWHVKSDLIKWHFF